MVHSHESQSGPRKLNLLKPVSCYRGHIWSVSKCEEFCKITIFTRSKRRMSVSSYVVSKLM